MAAPPRKLPPKRDVLDAFLGKGSARIFLDPRRDGVLVPKWFASQAELVLRVGRTLKPPIADLVVDDEAVSCTLSFNRSPSWCKLPWTAVFAVVSDVDGRGIVWPDDVPIESQLLRPTKPKPPALVRDEAPQAPPEEASRPAKRGARKESAAPRPPVAEPKRVIAPAAPVKPPVAPVRPLVGPSRSGESPGGKKPKRELPPYLRVVK